MGTYLIEIVGLQDEGGDDTGTSSGLDNDIEATEEHELLGAHGGGVGLLLDGEDGTVLVVLELGAIELLEDGARALGEVAVDAVLAEGRVSRAGCEKQC